MQDLHDPKKSLPINSFLHLKFKFCVSVFLTWGFWPDDFGSAGLVSWGGTEGAPWSRRFPCRRSSRSTSWSPWWRTRRTGRSPAACSRHACRGCRCLWSRACRPAPRSRPCWAAGGPRCTTAASSCRNRSLPTDRNCRTDTKKNNQIPILYTVITNYTIEYIFGQI